MRITEVFEFLYDMILAKVLQSNWLRNIKQFLENVIKDLFKSLIFSFNPCIDTLYKLFSGLGSLLKL